MNRIFIMGYMGSGKSTIGKKLAKKMQCLFIDLDKYIEEKYSKKISDIFKDDGEDTFRELEHDALKEVIKIDNVVISLGGGTPCFMDNINLINDNGISVYLKMPAKVLLQRLENAKTKRPLLEGVGDNEKMEFIQQQLGEREKFYLKSHLIYNAFNTNVDVLLRQLQDVNL